MDAEKTSVERDKLLHEHAVMTAALKDIYTAALSGGVSEILAAVKAAVVATDGIVPHG